MPKKTRGLARGLDALLPELDTTAPGAGQEIAIGDIDPNPDQPRHIFSEESIAQLAQSIKDQGILQPILVTPVKGGRYRIVAGERRWRAARAAGLNAVPCIVREMDVVTQMEIALIENIQREDLNPLEEAQALARLIEEFMLTHAQAAEAVGRSRAAVSNLLRLLELPPAIRKLVEQRRLEMGHARALLTLAPELAAKLAAEAAEHGWSVREVEHRAQQFADGRVPARKGRAAAKPRPQQADIAALENELAQSLGAKVSIAHGRGGKGRLVIHYSDLDSLEGVLGRLRKPG